MESCLKNGVVVDGIKFKSLKDAEKYLLSKDPVEIFKEQCRKKMWKWKNEKEEIIEKFGFDIIYEFRSMNDRGDRYLEVKQKVMHEEKGMEYRGGCFIRKIGELGFFDEMLKNSDALIAQIHFGYMDK